MWGLIIFLAAMLGLTAIIKDVVSFLRNSSHKGKVNDLGYSGSCDSGFDVDFVGNDASSYDLGSSCDGGGFDAGGGCDGGY